MARQTLSHEPVHPELAAPPVEAGKIGGEAEARDNTAALLAGMWARNQPLIERRLAVLERAATLALARPLQEELRAEAVDIAHKLAGSLGMFGFAEGTSIARDLETMLEDGVPDAARFAQAAARLRPVLFPGGAARGDGLPGAASPADGKTV